MSESMKHCCSKNNTADNEQLRKTHVNQAMIVTKEDWNKAHQAFLKKEKEHTRERDKLNAERRHLPMVEITKNYTFNGLKEQYSLLDLFAGKKQLIVYHFMFDPSWAEGCDGCSMMVDNIGHQAHLRARDTTLVLISRAPMEKIHPFKKRMEWALPWYSSFNSDFNYDFGATTKQGEETHGYSVFLQDNNKVYHTYSTGARGVEYLGSNWSYLDITPMGRQEDWENSPTWVRKTPRYEWWKHHDKYTDSLS